MPGYSCKSQTNGSVSIIDRYNISLIEFNWSKLNVKNNPFIQKYWILISKIIRF